MRAVFDRLNNSYAKYYSLTEHLAVDEIIVLFKGRVIFKQYIPKKYKWFGIKSYLLCDSKGYTYNIMVHLRKDDDLHIKTMNCCGTGRPNRKGMLKNFGHTMKLKSGDLKTKLKGNLRAIVWKDKQNVNILTNMHSPPLKGNSVMSKEKL